MSTDNVNPTMTPQFYNATQDQETKPTTAVVRWIAFPKQVCRFSVAFNLFQDSKLVYKVKLQHPNDEERWKVADADRGVQDEYLEW